MQVLIPPPVNLQLSSRNAFAKNLIVKVLREKKTENLHFMPRSSLHKRKAESFPSIYFKRVRREGNNLIAIQ